MNPVFSLVENQQNTGNNLCGSRVRGPPCYIINNYLILFFYFQCDSGLGAYRLYELIYQEKDQKVVIISGCSTVCTTLAEAASQWNLVTVCYGASSPALSNRERFFLIKMPFSLTFDWSFVTNLSTHRLYLKSCSFPIKVSNPISDPSLSNSS